MVDDATLTKVAGILLLFRGIFSVEDWKKLGQILEESGATIAQDAESPDEQAMREANEREKRKDSVISKPAMDSARTSTAEAEFRKMFPAARRPISTPGVTASKMQE